MNNGTEIILADSKGETPFVVVRTIRNGHITNQEAIKSLKLHVDAHPGQVNIKVR